MCSRLSFKVQSYVDHSEGVLKYNFVLESMIGSWVFSASLIPSISPEKASLGVAGLIESITYLIVYNGLEYGKLS